MNIDVPHKNKGRANNRELGNGCWFGKIPMKKKFTAYNNIEMFLHCKLCLDDMPRGISPKEHADISVGWTIHGFQAWCNRHEANIIHVNFEGQKHKAITYAHRKGV